MGKRLALEEQHRNDVQCAIYRERPSENDKETLDRGICAARNLRVCT
jgi:hypothetical protein